MAVFDVDDPKLSPLLRKGVAGLGRREAVSCRFDDTHVAMLVKTGGRKVVALVMDPWAASHLVSVLAGATSEIGYIDRQLMMERSGPAAGSPERMGLGRRTASSLVGAAMPDPSPPDPQEAGIPHIDADLWRTAVHEAGHAVATLALGVEPQGVELFKDGKDDGRGSVR